MIRKAQADYVTKLRTEAKVERLDKKDEPAAAPAPDAKAAPGRARQEEISVTVSSSHSDQTMQCPASRRAFSFPAFSFLLAIHSPVAFDAPLFIPDQKPCRRRSHRSPPPSCPICRGSPACALRQPAAGIRYKNRTDVLLALFDKGTTVAGVFTKSKCPSAAVDWCLRQTQGRRSARTGGQFRQRQCLHRKTGKQATTLTASIAAKAADTSGQQDLPRLHRRDRRTAPTPRNSTACSATWPKVRYRTAGTMRRARS